MNCTVQLSEREIRFLEEEVTAGRFASASDVVREALLLLMALQETPRTFEGEELERLRTAWNEGLASGEARELDFEELKREGRRRLAART